MTAKLHTRPVADDEDGIRLDRWFKRHFSTLTHGQLQKLLRTGQVRVEGKRAETSTRLAAGQNIRVPPQATQDRPPAAAKKPEMRNAEKLKKLVLFEDDDVIVLNKPAGLAVQGGTGLKENIDDMLEVFAHKKHGKPRLVHRLDRDTSGVLLVAKSPSAAAKLSESFRDRRTQKIYWGVTLGEPTPFRGRIEAALVKKGELMTVATDEELKNEKSRTKSAKKHGIRDRGEEEKIKTAITVYQIMEPAKGQAAFVAMWPITGRTHQLRVHMASLGTPLLGDPLYGKPTPDNLPGDELGKGLHLHARRLIIPHPRRGIIDVTAPLGPDMRKTWSWFGFDRDAEADFDGA